MRYFLLLGLFFANSHVALGIADLPNILVRFEKDLIKVSKKYKVPGFSVAIVHRDQVVYLKGFGVQNLQSRQPVTPYTIFQLASISKPIAGTLMGLLHTQQVLSLEDPVVQYLPHFSVASGLLKVQHLITHTTGLPRQGFNQLIESKNSTRATIIQHLQQVKLLGHPGAHYDYHNASFSLLEEVVAAATQYDFGYNLRKWLLIPLGMTRTSWSYQALQEESDRAWPHVKNSKGKEVVCKDYTQGYYKVVSAGGINSCAYDMGQFLMAQLGYKPEVVSQETLTLLHQPFIKGADFFHKVRRGWRFKDARYGLGWRILTYGNHKLLFHGGMLKGFVHVLALVPEKEVGIIILQNCQSSFAWDMMMRFVDDVLELPVKRWG